MSVLTQGTQLYVAWTRSSNPNAIKQADGTSAWATAGSGGGYVRRPYKQGEKLAQDEFVILAYSTRADGFRYKGLSNEWSKPLNGDKGPDSVPVWAKELVGKTSNTPVVVSRNKKSGGSGGGASGDDSDWDVFEVECITSFSGLSNSRDQIEDTCLSETVARTYKPGLATPASISVGLNADPSNESHYKVFEASQDTSNVILSWALGWADGTSAPNGVDENGDFDLPNDRTWLTFHGYISDFPFDFSANAVVASTVTIQQSGAVHWILKGADNGQGDTGGDTGTGDDVPDNPLDIDSLQDLIAFAEKKLQEFIKNPIAATQKEAEAAVRAVEDAFKNPVGALQDLFKDALKGGQNSIKVIQSLLNPMSVFNVLKDQISKLPGLSNVSGLLGGLGSLGNLGSIGSSLGGLASGAGLSSITSALTSALPWLGALI